MSNPRKSEWAYDEARSRRGASGKFGVDFGNRFLYMPQYEVSAPIEFFRCPVGPFKANIQY